ncbi:uncharacterized protein ASPGLDRAFT_335951 [Aspergillus glaucus CBS 516.65]|uniref:Uncharacterized protein n=1 Tax=Aspergillus glaucus CBS 516.65 TaxID=1160497 RepID=A0A1L9VII4_ASPGL|nr:hypothetical protein ASPGLDRAFT_335951 [Aspergillus glaucus CBS 516.65]OJJ83710.1 hypothetical protein ASPGLDRAFT_335951 [Aspergillus glaucus CBS 516.65]
MRRDGIIEFQGGSSVFSFARAERSSSGQEDEIALDEGRPPTADHIPRLFSHLPRRWSHEVRSLYLEYGESFNRVFPLFGARFRSERKKFVFSQVPEGSPLQLCLDVMLGFMYREKGYTVWGNDRDRYWLRATALITRPRSTSIGISLPQLGGIIRPLSNMHEKGC